MKMKLLSLKGVRVLKIKTTLFFVSLLVMQWVSSLDAQATDRQTFQVKHKGGVLELVRFRVPGDGDCALHGLEKSRADLVQALVKNAGDPFVQEMLRDELFDQHFIPELQAPITEEAVLSFARQKLSYSSEFLSFQGQWQFAGDPEPDLVSVDETLQSSGTLAAAAYLFGLNVRVWTAQGSHGLQLNAKYINQPGAEFIDLLHSVIHFDRLVPIDDLVMAQRFHEKENARKNEMWGSWEPVPREVQRVPAHLRPAAGSPVQVKKAKPRLKTPQLQTQSFENFQARRAQADESFRKALLFGDAIQAQLAIQQGANFEIRDQRGFSPLVLATLSRNVEMVKVLLESGANSEAQGPYGNTPIGISVMYNHFKIFELLHSYGADPFIETFDGVRLENMTRDRQLLKWIELSQDKFKLRTGLKFIFDRDIQAPKRLTTPSPHSRRAEIHFNKKRIPSCDRYQGGGFFGKGQVRAVIRFSPYTDQLVRAFPSGRQNIYFNIPAGTTHMVVHFERICGYSKIYETTENSTYHFDF